MKQFLATSLAAIAAAVTPANYAGDEAFHARMDEKAELGQTVVDQVVDDPYSLSGTYNVHDTEECEHAIGHDGTADYVRLVPEVGIADDDNIAGDFIYVDTKVNGKHIYVNESKNKVFIFTGNDWSIESTDDMDDFISGKAKKFARRHIGSGSHDRPEVVVGFHVTFEHEMDLEPEWRCLLRPLLRTAVEKVEKAELSIESKAILDEKKALIEVHERLVQEAEQRKEEASCIELIERAMARLEECELVVLRDYVKIADTYPTSWLQLLNEKRDCVDTFAKETATCNHLWEEQWGRYYG